jgi:hypothetical protein
MRLVTTLQLMQWQSSGSCHNCMVSAAAVPGAAMPVVFHALLCLFCPLVHLVSIRQLQQWHSKQ